MKIGRCAFDIRMIASDAPAPFSGSSGDDVVNAAYRANLLIEMLVSGKDDICVLDDFGLQDPLEMGIRSVAPRHESEPTVLNIRMDRVVKIQDVPAIFVRLAQAFPEPAQPAFDGPVLPLFNRLDPAPWNSGR